MEGVRTGRAERRSAAPAHRRDQEDRRQSARSGRAAAACARRGQAAVQSLYHPDRLRGPHASARASAERRSSRPVSWDEAIATRRGNDRQGALRRSGEDRVPDRGRRRARARWRSQRFAQALGAPAPVACSIADHRRRAQGRGDGVRLEGPAGLRPGARSLCAGRRRGFPGRLGVAGILRARSSVHFRQGRREHPRPRWCRPSRGCRSPRRAADRWLPLRPGTEPQFLPAVGRMLLDERLARNRDRRFRKACSSASSRPTPARCWWRLRSGGEARPRRCVRELGESEAPLVIGGRFGGAQQLARCGGRRRTSST